MSGTLALDIETVSPTVPADSYPDFDDSTDFELLAVGLGYQAKSGAPAEDVTVLFRDGWSADAELSLIDEVIEWCTGRDADSLLTYNGGAFDMVHLSGRARLAGEQAGSTSTLAAFESLADEIEHDDLKPAAWDAWGQYTTLEECCRNQRIDVVETPWDEYEHGLEPSTWRRPADRGKTEVTGADIPQFGERYLNLCDAEADDSTAYHEISELIEHYTCADIEPLFELADSRPFLSKTT